MRLSDHIEQFIKDMLTEEEPQVELRRNELATYFSCAPSQINYVLATRFTVDHGYITESRRGGGGYIRIARITGDPSGQLGYLIGERIGGSLTEQEAGHLLAGLKECGAITENDAELIRSAVSSHALSVPMQEEVKDALRAGIMRSMLTAIARQGRGKEDGENAV